jgi:hypothetical protein
MGLRAAGGAAVMLAAAALGCATPGNGDLKVKLLDSATDEPANVFVYFSVDAKTGQPIPDLQSSSFKVYEDGKLIPEKKGRRVLVAPRVVEARFTLVLVDMSGPVVDTEYLPEVVSSLIRMSERLGRIHHQFAVSVFDGGDQLAPILGFGGKDAREALDGMRQYRPQNRTSNLNAAVMQGIQELEKQMAAATAPHKFGNLVLYTDRADLAHKVSPQDLNAALDRTPADVYVVAAGPGVKREELSAIARTAGFYSSEPKDIAKGFTETIRRIEVASAGRYLISYCTPKRKGEHRLEIVVVTEGDSGKLGRRYSAVGFKDGCTPKRIPVFEPKDDAKP